MQECVQIMVNRDFEVDCCLHRDNQKIDEIAKLDPPVQQPYWGIVDTVNGLFCLYNSCEKMTVVLWNPSLRKSLVLPESRVLSDSRIGFGFVAASNDYKILMLSSAYNYIVSRPTIYQLSTGSWHDVKLEDSLDFQVKFRQAHLKGVLHWYACNAGEVNPTFRNFICSFDLENEKFGTLMVPSCLCLRHDDDDSFFVPYAFKESLYLIDYERSHSCKIWVMKEYGVANAWQKLFDIDTQLSRLRTAFHLRHNGEILFDGKDNFPGYTELVSYDCYINKRAKNDGSLTNRHILSIHNYVESLALIKLGCK